MEEEVRVIDKIEKRFLEISGFDCDLDKFPLEEGDCPEIKNNKKNSDLHGEVFTPLWFVDKMILKAPESLIKAKTTLDLCAGYGQFTIRMLRFLDIENNRKNFRPNVWLKNVHSFSEYQVSSAYKLLYIFGTDINLFVGDARQLTGFSKGVWFHGETSNQWYEITDPLKTIFKSQDKYLIESEKKFIKEFDKIKAESNTKDTTEWMDMEK